MKNYIQYSYGTEWTLFPRCLLLQLGLYVPDILTAAAVAVALEEGIDGAHGAVFEIIADMPIDADALMSAHGIAYLCLIVFL